MTQSIIRRLKKKIGETQIWLMSAYGPIVPPEENFGRAIPPEPEKIARYIVLSGERWQKIGGQKNLPPKNPFSGRFMRGIRKKILNPKFCEKLIFTAL